MPILEVNIPMYSISDNKYFIEIHENTVMHFKSSNGKLEMMCRG
jgi:hypothetical protein